MVCTFKVYWEQFKIKEEANLQTLADHSWIRSMMFIKHSKGSLTFDGRWGLKAKTKTKTHKAIYKKSVGKIIDTTLTGKKAHWVT